MNFKETEKVLAVASGVYVSAVNHSDSLAIRAAFESGWRAAQVLADDEGEEPEPQTQGNLANGSRTVQTTITAAPPTGKLVYGGVAERLRSSEGLVDQNLETENETTVAEAEPPEKDDAEPEEDEDEEEEGERVAKRRRQLAAVAELDDNGFTVADVAKHMNLKLGTANAMIRRWADKGWLTSPTQGLWVRTSHYPEED